MPSLPSHSCRKLALCYPGRSVYAKLVCRIYRWKRVHKLPSVEKAFEAHQNYTLNKISSSLIAEQNGCEDEDDDVAIDARDSTRGREKEDCRLSLSPKRLTVARRPVQAVYSPTTPSAAAATATDKERTSPLRRVNRSLLPSQPITTLSGASASARHALVRDVIEEVLPALLQQQKALIGSAFCSMRSSADDIDDSDDTTMIYGCRRCETLHRQLLHMEAQQASLEAELESVKATRLTTTTRPARQSVLQAVIYQNEGLQTFKRLEYINFIRHRSHRLGPHDLSVSITVTSFSLV